VALSDQFAHPRGFVGSLVGHFMALENRPRSQWALSLLAAAAGERILEIGFGPGTDLTHLAEAVGKRGFVGGVDVSAAMVRQAAWRNQKYIQEGRVILQQAGATDLPYPDASFQAVYAVNSAQFWPDLPRAVSEIGRVLRPGGRVVLVVQPRGAPETEGERWRDRLVKALTDGGFSDVNGALGPLLPAPGAAFGRKSKAE
jgi:ubiquinone/menaquinone biosynthesis C-methylase UbiE